MDVNSLQLFVSTLNVCRAEDVQIDEDVYHLLSPYLEYITVVLSDEVKKATGVPIFRLFTIQGLRNSVRRWCTGRPS